MDISATQLPSSVATRIAAAAVAGLLATASSAALASPYVFAGLTNGTFVPTSATESSGSPQLGENIVGSGLTGWTVGNCESNIGSNCTPGTSPAFVFQMLASSYTNGVAYNNGGSYANVLFQSTGPGALVVNGTTIPNAIAVDAQNLPAPLSQQVTNLLIGDNYTLTFYQASTQANGTINTNGFTGNWQVGLCATVSSSTGACGTYLNSSTMNNPQGGSTPWVLQTLTFTATSATETLSFLASSPSVGQPPFLLLADTSLSWVPEPDNLLMLAGGMGGLLLLRKRRAA
jgi:hypothetical protein